MSLYRSWRPRSFADLVGQDAVVRTLSTALAAGRLSHAYLFSGPRGSGKTSAAKILARCINCEHGPTATPDNTCAFCLAMIAGTALDVQEIDAASNRGIDEIRALREAVKFAPQVMRSKVFIVDEAHMLTKEGANAFLKTLEEPPPNVVFILATTAPEALPPTILSRCQRYAFRRIPIATMIDRMRTIADAERIAIDDAALGAIAYRADGGLRDALTMLEQVSSFAGGAVDVQAVDAAFGSNGRNYARGLMEAILAHDAAEGLRIIDDASDAGADMHGLIRSTVAEFRHILVARINPSLLARDLAQGDAERAEALAATTPQVKVVRALRLLSDALAAGRLSGAPRLEVETALLRLVAIAEDPTLEALSARVAMLEGGARPGGVSAAPPQPAAHVPPQPRRSASASPPPAAPPAERTPRAAVAVAAPEAAAEPGEPTLGRVRSLWASIRTHAEENYRSLKAPLAQATVEEMAGGKLVIGHHDDLQVSILRDKLPILARAASDVLGTAVNVSVVTMRTRSSQRDAQPANAEIAANPDDDLGLLAYAMQQFTEGGER